MKASQSQLERITERRTLDQRDLDAWDEAHLEQAHGHATAPRDGSNACPLPDLELIEGSSDAATILKRHFNGY